MFQLPNPHQPQETGGTFTATTMAQDGFDILSMNEAELRQLVEENPGSVNSGDPAGRTPLFYAAQREYSVLVTWLVDEKGADVNAQNFWGKTPLYYAKSADIVATLLNGGADVTVSDRWDRYTPLMCQILLSHVKSTSHRKRQHARLQQHK